LHEPPGGAITEVIWVRLTDDVRVDAREGERETGDILSGKACEIVARRHAATAANAANWVMSKTERRNAMKMRNVSKVEIEMEVEMRWR
jgi:hypothetical protein